MSIGGRAKTQTIYREAGVRARRLKTGFVICLPRATSVNHLLCIVARLWEVRAAVRCHVSEIDLNWTVDVSEFDDLPLPLIFVISAIEADLGQVGRKLRVVRRSSLISMDSAVWRLQGDPTGIAPKHSSRCQQ